MQLITTQLEEVLTRNAAATLEAYATGAEPPQHKPALKVFDPSGAATWLLTELDKETGLLFGLCDLGMGSPELGYVSLAELKSYRGPFGLGLERDRHFTPNKTLTEYADQARMDRRVSA